MYRRFLTRAVLAIITSGLFSCQTLKSTEPEPVYLPFMKNTPNECYYLDEFMPAPDGLVRGRTNDVSLRYYTYKCANYKDWQRKHIILSFYSQDDHCWSLFEEYYVDD